MAFHDGDDAMKLKNFRRECYKAFQQYGAAGIDWEATRSLDTDIRKRRAARKHPLGRKTQVPPS